MGKPPLSDADFDPIVRTLPGPATIGFCKAHIAAGGKVPFISREWVELQGWSGLASVFGDISGWDF